MNPILALILANTIWGAASPIFKFALQNIPPFTLAFVRFFGASLLFLPLAASYKKKIKSRQFFEIFLGAFFGITLNIPFYFFGLKLAPSINAPIISSTGPIFIFLFSVIFLKEKPHLKVFLGMLTALCGALTIILSPVLVNNQAFVLGEIEGNLFFLVATLSSVILTLIYKDVLKKINPYVVAFWGFLFASVTFFPFFVVEQTIWSFSQINIQGLTGIIFGVLLSSSAGYFLYYYGLSKLEASEVGLFTYIDPVVTILIAIPLLGEYPTKYFLVGSFLVFLGIYVAEGRIHWHPLHKLKNKR